MELQLKMSEFVEIKNILEGLHDRAQVRIRGWLQNSRSSGGIQFLMLRDGSGTIQCIINRNNIDEELFDRLEKLNLESTLELSGVVEFDERAPDNREMNVEKAVILNEALPDFPIVRKEHGIDFLLDNRHLYVRDPKLQNIFKLRAKFLQAAREWFKEHNYTETQSPLFITAACEGGSTLFDVDYFERKGVYLSQSWQLYAEAMIASLGKIYTIAPSFRAEPSRTRRHLSEYWHMEVEEPWSTLNDIIKVGDELVCHIAHNLARDMPRELKKAGRYPKELLKLKPPFPKISYDQAVEILQDQNIDMFWGDDFGYQQEEPLTQQFDTPFWVVGFPRGVKPFYHMPDPDRPEVTLSADLLAPQGYGEIIGGGQRVHDYQELLDRIFEDGLEEEDYSWYIDIRKWGTIPHSGFGLGVERVLMWMLKLDHIRDTIPFPRDIRRVYP
jgi:asparaginyl-tRNA synthetase